MGEWENSDSPYGTFDQGSNVYEWNETVVDNTYRSLQGGYWPLESLYLHASFRGGHDPSIGNYHLGFRVASIPEPGSITLLACGAVAGLVWWRRRRKR